MKFLSYKCPSHRKKKLPFTCEGSHNVLHFIRRGKCHWRALKVSNLRPMGDIAKMGVWGWTWLYPTPFVLWMPSPWGIIRVFFKEFLFVVSVLIIHRKMKRKWQSSLGRLSQISYKPKIKYKYLIIFLYFWLHNENQKMNLEIFYLFFHF